MRSLCRLLCGLMLAAPGIGVAGANAQNPVADARTLTVSPDGDDNNPGTRERPIRTLPHARDLVRTMNRNMGGDITVYLRGGVYRLPEPLTLDASDSGANGHDVIYTFVPGEQPVISGGVQVTDWKRVDAGKNLWSAPAPAGLKNTRQLYIDGVRAQRARGRLPVSLTQTRTGYTASSDVMSRWRNLGDIEFVYTGGNSLWSERSEGLGSWTEPRCPVASIQGTTITMAQPCWDNSTRRVMLPSGKRAANLVGPAHVGKQPAYVENAFELLGTPGQWYLDRPANTLYYVPRPGEDLTKADVEAPVLEMLVSGQGTGDHPVHDIVFSGLQFSYATWLTPSTGEGFSEIQANYCVTGPDGYAIQGLGSLVPDGKSPFGAWTRTPGNVSFRYGSRLRFLNDAFVHLGGAGLELGNGSQADTVQGCVFTDISANGLELGGVDLPMASDIDVTRDNNILDNHVYEVGAEYHGAIGICVGYAQRTTIRHNQIDHLPYAGISMGWGGWLDKIQQAGVANNSQHNLVTENLIFDHMLLLSDGGGIYTQGLTGPTLADGEKVTGNVITDQFGSGHAIYTDNGSCNITVANNVMFHTNHDNWAGHHGDYYDGNNGKVYDPLAILNNYWQQGNPDSDSKNITLQGNRLINSLDQAPASLLRNAGLEPAYKALLKRQFASPSAPEPPSRVAAAAGNGSAYVAWNPPVLLGGAPVDSYTVTSSKGDKVTISAADFRTYAYVKVPGLANGTDVTFTVTATNANGASAPSLPSLPVTPEAAIFAKPAAPAKVSAFAGDGMTSIHLHAPAPPDDSLILAYTFTVNPGGRKVTLTGRNVLILSGTHEIFGVVDGLQNGQTYTFDVAAVNVAGEGAPARTAPVTPAPQAKNITRSEAQP